jgi:carboxyl-terminal processing protease
MPKITLFIVRKIFLTVCLIIACFLVGYFLGSRQYQIQFESFRNIKISREVPPDKSVLDFSLFWQVWDTVEAKYFDKNKIVPAEMVYGAIKGMVESLGDPYTVFLTPTENKVVNEDLNGSFEGIGIQIGFKGTQLAVMAPLPNSPAEKAGIKPGDFIIGIKDESKKIDHGTTGLSLNQAVEEIRGPRGSKVTLTLLREGVTEPLVIELTRAKLDVPSLILNYVGDNGKYTHLELLKFGAETTGEWKKAVDEIIKKKEVAGIILDIRNNPGGYLQGAIDIAAEFMKVGSVAVIEEKSNGIRNEFKTERIGLLSNTKVVVLINGGSASASEILAGALRDGKNIKLIGEKTFGKGTIQEPDELPGGAGIHITTAKWLTPSGYWVNEKGLEPDFKVEDNVETTEDEQLQKAIEFLNSQ